MKQWTIRHRILASFGVILTLMIVMAGVAYSRLMAIHQHVENVEQHSLPGLYNASALQKAWSDDFLITEDLVLQQDASERRRLEAALQANRAQLDKLSHEYEQTEFTDADRRAYEAFTTIR